LRMGTFVAGHSTWNKTASKVTSLTLGANSTSSQVLCQRNASTRILEGDNMSPRAGPSRPRPNSP
jgi:hypothetical protein